MAFEVLITDEALADLDSVAGFMKRKANVVTAQRLLASIIASIETLQEMPARCPVAAEAEELGYEVRILLHGRGKQTYKIYYSIDSETPFTGKSVGFQRASLDSQTTGRRRTPGSDR